MAQQDNERMYSLLKDSEIQKRVLWQRIKGDLLAMHELWQNTSRFTEDYANFRQVRDVIKAAIVSMAEAIE